MDTVPLQQLKKEMVLTIRIMLGEGLYEYNTGHPSVRIPGTSNILILGHLHEIGKRLEDVCEDDLVVMDMDGRRLEGPTDPPGELFIHTGIYKKRPEINSVIHYHPSLPIAFSVAEMPILPITHRATLFQPGVPIFPSAVQIDTAELGDAVAEAMGSNYAVLLQGHGVAVAGDSLKTSCCAALILQQAARVQHMASVLGKPKTISSESLGLPFMGLNRREFFGNVWNYYAGKYSKDYEHFH